MNLLKTKIKHIKKIKLQFVADIQFGIISKDCINYGICRINLIDKFQIPYIPKNKCSTAIVSVFNQNHIEMDFFRSRLSKNDYEKFFSKEKFVVEEDFSDRIENCLIHIPQGNYLINKNDTLIKIIFKSN